MPPCEQKRIADWLGGEPVPPGPPGHSTAAILLVSPIEEDHEFFSLIFQPPYWRVYRVRSYSDALDSLNRDHMAVIICESCLAGGSWKDILSHTQILPDPPCVIVTALLPDDRLWAEVLNLGGYDLLAKPFVREEVMRIAELASMSWRRAAEIRVHVTAPQQASRAAAAGGAP